MVLSHPTSLEGYSRTEYKQVDLYSYREALGRRMDSATPSTGGSGRWIRFPGTVAPGSLFIHLRGNLIRIYYFM